LAYAANIDVRRIGQLAKFFGSFFLKKEHFLLS